MDLHANVLGQLQRILAAGTPDGAKLERALRLLAKWRSATLQNALVRTYGTAVQSGPFKGMQFVRRSAEGCHIPKLLGCYEQELHTHIERAIARGYRHVVNIGVAEGYYAVGLARRMPNALVHAFDASEKAQRACRELAQRNGVETRVEIGGLFAGEAFANYPARDTLVICDIEGEEEELLDPGRFPGLAEVDLIAELHECFKPGILDTVRSRFAGTHDIAVVSHAGRDIALPAMFDTLGHLDRLLAVWEWRTGPTPWAVMLRS